MSVDSGDTQAVSEGVMHTPAYHGPNVTESRWCRQCIRWRAEPVLALDGGAGKTFRQLLQAWGIAPDDFVESMQSYGFTVTKGNR